MLIELMTSPVHIAKHDDMVMTSVEILENLQNSICIVEMNQIYHNTATMKKFETNSRKIKCDYITLRNIKSTTPLGSLNVMPQALFMPQI